MFIVFFTTRFQEQVYGMGETLKDAVESLKAHNEDFEFEELEFYSAEPIRVRERTEVTYSIAPPIP